MSEEVSKSSMGSFELGQLYFDRCDLLTAVPHLEKAAQLFREEKNFAQFLKCKNMLLRVYVEQEDNESIASIKEELQDLVLKEGFELNSRTFYTLAICAYARQQFDLAKEYLQKSLTLALATDHKEDMCYAIFGMATLYSATGKYEEALKEIYNLGVFFQVLNVPDVEMSAEILNGRILLDMGRPQEAVDVFWQSYSRIREQKSIIRYVYLLFNMGKAHLALGDKEMARLYLKLAHQAVDPKNMPYLLKGIESDLAQISDNGKTNFDLVFNLEDHVVVERKLGKVDFKNQFILLDLLKLFVQNQGTVYSKEILVQRVWKQDYDPAVHDNKIYVTIKRLRKMIEPDFDKPKYIFRAKNGYFMNKSARVYIDQMGEH